MIIPWPPDARGEFPPLAGRHDGDIHSALKAKSFSDVTRYQTNCTLGANNPAISPSPGARGTVRIPPSGIVRCRMERRRAKCPASPWRGLDQPLSGPDRFPVANSLLRGEGCRIYRSCAASNHGQRIEPVTQRMGCRRCATFAPPGKPTLVSHSFAGSIHSRPRHHTPISALGGSTPQKARGAIVVHRSPCRTSRQGPPNPSCVGPKTGGPPLRFSRRSASRFGSQPWPGDRVGRRRHRAVAQFAHRNHSSRSVDVRSMASKGTLWCRVDRAFGLGLLRALTLPARGVREESERSPPSGGEVDCRPEACEPASARV